MGDIDPSESRPRLRSHVAIDFHIDSHAVGACSDDGEGRECFQQPEEFPVLNRLGMLPCALEGWSRVYKSPLKGIIVTYVACCAYWGTLVLRLPSAPMDNSYAYILTYPLIMALFGMGGVLSCVWRYGPVSVLQSQAMNLVVLVVAPCNLCNILAGFLVPRSLTPFGSSLAYTAVTCLAVLGLNTVYQAIPLTLPPQPRASIRPMLIDAAAATLRMMDALTDVTFVFVLLEERRNGCWWFGVGGQCGTLMTLTVVLTVCAVADFLVANAMSLAGDKSSARAKRWVFLCHVLSLVLELAVMAVMFLQIASSAKHPHKGEVRSGADDIAITVVSLCTTLVTFVLTMIGAGSSLAGLRVVAKRISATGANMFRSRGTSVTGCTSKVEPLATAVDADTVPAQQEPSTCDL